MPQRVRGPALVLQFGGGGGGGRQGPSHGAEVHLELHRERDPEDDGEESPTEYTQVEESGAEVFDLLGLLGLRGAGDASGQDRNDQPNGSTRSSVVKRYGQGEQPVDQPQWFAEPQVGHYRMSDRDTGASGLW